MGTFLKKLQPKLAEIQLKSEESERKVEEVKADIDNSPTLTDPEKEKLLKRVSELDGFSATKIMRDLTANLASIPDFSSLFVPIKGISGLSPEVLKSLENSNAAAMAGYASLFRSLEKSPLQSKKKKNKDE